MRFNFAFLSGFFWLNMLDCWCWSCKGKLTSLLILNDDSCGTDILWCPKFSVALSLYVKNKSANVYKSKLKFELSRFVPALSMNLLGCPISYLDTTKVSKKIMGVGSVSSQKASSLLLVLWWTSSGSRANSFWVWLVLLYSAHLNQIQTFNHLEEF